MEYITETRNIPCKDNYDVIVVGGGVAGIAAAVSASRLGTRTLLIEKSGILGGLATLGLIAWYEPLCDGEGHQMIYGIAEELLKLSIRYGYGDIPKSWQEGSPELNPQSPRYACFFSANIFALALDRFLVENGVDVRFDMVASYPVMEGGHCNGIITESKSGREYFPCSVVIDASGDADIIDRAGMPTVVHGKNYLTLVAMRSDLDSYKKALEGNDILMGRIWDSSGSNLEGTGHPEGMHYFTGISNEDVTEYLMESRKLLFEKIKDEDRRSRDIITLPGMAQFRKTRRINGEYVLKESDVYRHFDDSIGTAGDFLYRGQRFEIPYRCLYKKGYDNILASGRIISSDDRAWEVARVIPVAAMTGGAAGVAAHLAVKHNLAVEDVAIDKLQSTLTETQSVQIHIPEELAKVTIQNKEADWAWVAEL
jgi:hypothetical protein